MVSVWAGFPLTVFQYNYPESSAARLNVLSLVTLQVTDETFGRLQREDKINVTFPFICSMFSLYLSCFLLCFLLSCEVI